VRTLITVVACSVLCACASTQAIEEERDILTEKLRTAQDRTEELEACLRTQEQQIGGLQEENAKLETARESLTREKTVRTEQAREMRRLARQFIRNQSVTLRTFSENPVLLDYVGGEAIERKRHEEGGGGLIVDLAHPLPREGMLFSGQAFVRKPLPFFFCLVRPLEGGHHIIWMSKRCVPAEPGPITIHFDAGVAVQAGDLVAVCCPEGIGIPFDEMSGQCAEIKGGVTLGQELDAAAFGKAGTRNYSFGVRGFLE
jgi:hypothetical protein